ncbi:hypothetical protein [Anaerophilus nitritogenes]|uniref:hypothetical protein n=1 Tax=Anaerophilus nitritogenes TaxID=2498136 RepID=UPI00101C1ABE|nr:hypothetical protein [Anaerophilus nitritogenes]
MKRKSLILLMSGILIIGVATGFGYANSKSNKDTVVSKVNIEKKLWKNDSQLKNNNNKNYKDMIKTMKKNGYENVADYMKNNDYKAMDEFMNNMTDEDYKNMIDIMKNSGYEDMARMMESVDKDTMIQMHNAMGGAEGCHGDSSNMMGSF